MNHLKKALAVVLIGLFLLSAVPVFADEVYWQGITEKFVVYKAVKPNYSGPACAKAVLMHLVETPIDQSAIARESGTAVWGTQMMNLVKTMNNYQVYKKFASYRGPDKGFVLGVIYDTVVQRDTPAIIGIQPEKKLGWPHDGMDRKYVLVYEVSADLAWVKIADPLLISEDGGTADAFYTVSTDVLFDSYRRAGLGVAYAVAGAGKLSEDVPQGEVSIMVPEELGKAEYFKLNFDLVNTTAEPVYYNEYFTLERKEDGIDEWEVVRIPEDYFSNVSYKLDGGRLKSFSTSVMKELRLSKGAYRISKEVLIEGEKTVVYSNVFNLVLDRK